MRREIRDSLENILELVSEDLRFAETKNAALLTANAAAVVGILQVDPSSQGVEAILGVYLNILTVVCTISGVISLISFIPRGQNPYPAGAPPPSPTDNLLFYGHIQKYEPDDYLRAVYAAAERAGEAGSEMERMYAEQIVVSSRIASRKFTYFRWAIWTTIAGLIMPPLAYVLYLAINANQRERALAILKRAVARPSAASSTGGGSEAPRRA